MRSQIPSPVHKTGDELHGFRITGVTPIPDIKALAYEATHTQTGAEVVHVHCHDEENLFSVGFRTPPSDSTGVAHILEHCVLAGSKKFPVKDAFNELGKRTLNTFLNAMTWPDRTVYPTCSAVKTDYFNLASVYVDLVFNPLITRETFQREGHHLELEEPGSPESPLKISGVVFNEMKGVYSSPDSFVGRLLHRWLMPDTPYAVDSGGDPAVIPDLTYEDFVAFHQRFYSPTNARFLLYGDIALAENLAFLETTLEGFQRVEVDSEIPRQVRWSAPRERTVQYPIGTEEPLEKQTFHALTWLLGDSCDVDETLLGELAMFALAGSAAGPVRKALIDSGLGSDIYPGWSFDASLNQSAAVLGLRGSEMEHADAVQGVILDTLAQVASDGIDSDLVDASFHHLAFHAREITPPFPLMILYRVNPPWYFGGDPKDGLLFGAALDRLRGRIDADPSLISTWIRVSLLENPHRLRLSASPSRTLQSEWRAAEAERLAEMRKGMDAASIGVIDAEAAALKASQEEPDAPEDLEKLPSLALSDIPRRVRTIPTVFGELGGAPALQHEVFSNGIGYVGLAFDSRDLNDEEAILLPLLGKITFGSGAAGLDYTSMTTRVARTTGGVGASPATGRTLGRGDRFERLTVSGSALLQNAGGLCAIIGDYLTESDLSDLKRVSDLVPEAASRMKSRLIPAGHNFAYRRAAATIDAALWRQEQWEGITQARFLSGWAKRVESDAPQLVERLVALQRKLFTRARLLVGVAGDGEVITALEGPLKELIARLPEGTPAGEDTASVPMIPSHAGVTIGGAVNYVAQVVRVPRLGDPAAPALELLSNVLSNELLYSKLRVQGGAYGGFSFYVGTSGILPFVSYRDPNLTETFDVYQSVVEFVESESFTDALVDSCRIGAIGSFDRILGPGQMLGTGRARHLLGLDDDARMAFREGLFSVDAAAIRTLALPHLRSKLADAPRGVLASREALDAANETLAEPLVVESVE
jgi:Zn-dependent M16 (insulinase) family peptidase